MTGRILCVALLAASSRCFADTAYLMNGDRLTGRLVALDAGRIALETAHAGEICLDTAGVSHLEVQSGAVLLLGDGRVLDSTLEPKTVVMAEVAALATDDAVLEPGAAPLGTQGPPERWSGAVETGLAMRSGNTDTTDFSLLASVEHKGEQDTLSVDLSAAYGEAEDVLNTRRAGAQAKWQVYPRERLYLFGLTGIEHDDGRKLDLRTNLGGGVGYDFIEAGKRTLSGDIGLDYTWERWDPYTPWGAAEAKDKARDAVRTQLPGYLAAVLANPLSLDTVSKGAGMLFSYFDPLRGAQPHTEEQLNLRLGAKYSQNLFRASTLEETLTLFPNLEETGEYRMTSGMTFSTPLRNDLRLNVNLKTEYDSRAGDRGVDSWDNALTTGVRYEF